MKFRATQDGQRNESLVPLKLKGYATGFLPSGEEGDVAYDNDKKKPVYYNGDSYVGFDASPFVNVKEYGLKGDGATDNTTVFQTLLDNIATAGKDVTLIFPDGVYVISGGLQDTSPLMDLTSYFRDSLRGRAERGIYGLGVMDVKSPSSEIMG